MSQFPTLQTRQPSLSEAFKNLNISASTRTLKSNNTETPGEEQEAHPEIIETTPTQYPRRAMNTQPTFAGKATEDVDLYIQQCRFAWAGVTMTEEDKREAIATTMFVGLQER